MKRLSIFLLLAATGCFEDFEPTDAPPSIDAVTLSCEDGAFALVVLASDANAVSDLWIAAEASDGSAQEWTLDKDLDFAETGSSQWRSVDALGDCDLTWSFTLTATNQLGIQATKAASWPEVVVEPGAVSPPYGSDAGSSVVVISGAGLTDVEEVLFGEVAATITAADETSITVATPAGTAGAVDVTLIAGGERTVLEEAFTYYADASGLVRGELYPAVTGFETAYINITSAYASTVDDFVQFELVFEAEPLEPELTYAGAWPTGGSCEWGSDAVTDWVDVGTYLFVANDTTGEWPAQHTDGNVYYVVTDGIDMTNWLGGSWDLEIINGTSDLPAMVVEDALLLPDAPIDPSFDFEAANTVSWGEDFELTWDPTSGYDNVLFTLLPATGSTALANYSCSGDGPGGSLSATWADLTNGIDETKVDGIYASITFLKEHETVLPHDNSVLWNQGKLTYWIYFPTE